MSGVHLFSDGGYEASLYHGSSGGAYFAFMQEIVRRDGSKRKSHEMFRVSAMNDVIRAAPKDRDSWISQAEFFGRRRFVSNIASVGLCFADLDTYKVPFGTHGTPEHRAEAFVKHCLNTGKPAPSIVLSSGRGLQAKWLFRHPVPFQALARWNAVQKYLTDPLDEFGVDKGARDASRLLRLVGTINTRSGEIVRPVWVSEGTDGIRTYDFDQFAHEILPYTREQIQERRAAREERERRRQERRVQNGVEARYAGLRPFDAQQLWFDRFLDIRTLAEIRGWSVYGVQEGYRNWFLFFSTCALSWSLAPDDIPREVDELARQYCPSFSPSDRRCASQLAIQRARAAARGETASFGGTSVDPRYRISNQTFIDRLGIEPAEERQLRTLISDAESQERHRARNRKEMDRAAYEGRAEERRTAAIELRGQGMKVREIADQMGVSTRSVEGYLRAPQNPQSPAYVYGEAYGR